MPSPAIMLSHSSEEPLGADGQRIAYSSRADASEIIRYYVQGFLVRRITEQLEPVDANWNQQVAPLRVQLEDGQKINVSLAASELTLWAKQTNETLQRQLEEALATSESTQHAAIIKQYQARQVTPAHLTAIYQAYQPSMGSPVFEISTRTLQSLMNSATIIVDEHFMPKLFYEALLGWAEQGLLTSEYRKTLVSKPSEDPSYIMSMSLEVQLKKSSLGKTKLGELYSDFEQFGFTSHSDLRQALALPLAALMTHAVHSQETLFLVHPAVLETKTGEKLVNQMLTGKIDHATRAVVISCVDLSRYLNTLTTQEIRLLVESGALSRQMKSLYRTLFTSAREASIQDCVIPPIGIEGLTENQALHQTICQLYIDNLFEVLQETDFKNRFEHIYFNPGSQMALAQSIARKYPELVAISGRKADLHKVVHLLEADTKLQTITLAAHNRRVCLVNPTSPDVLLGLCPPGQQILSEMIKAPGSYQREADLGGSSTILYGSKGCSNAYSPKKIRSRRYAITICRSIDKINEYIMLIRSEYTPSSVTYAFNNWLSQFRQLDFSSKLSAAQEIITLLRDLPEQGVFIKPLTAALQQGRLSQTIDEIASQLEALLQLDQYPKLKSPNH